ncbi:MAG: alpha-L-glutamate ligase-like protein [Wenzhouxiangella sp.]|nr:MAG: alpha-L-glutamate ligase-like protein [Wenzhouxiangella sp.]
MIRLYRELKKRGVLGLNARNARYIMPRNPRRYYPLVDNKILCKRRLVEHAVAVPELLGEVGSQYEAGHLANKLADLDEFVIKPASGSGGDGILVATGRYEDKVWHGSGGRLLALSDIEYHVSGILTGMYSLGGQIDTAMIESLVHTDQRFRQLAPEGVPDIRVILYRGIPVMAMTRLPTRRSSGKANLHQGAIGAGIDLVTGLTLRAVMSSRQVDLHPDTRHSVVDFQIPDWETLLTIATRCFEAIPLGYMGIDLVIDQDHGPLVLEMNARPGLAIQIANDDGLGCRLAAVDRLDNPESRSAQERLKIGLELARDDWGRK